MEHCTFCGSELPENARFCGKCGRVMEAGPFTAQIASTSISSNSGGNPGTSKDEEEQKRVIQGGAALPIAGQAQAGHIPSVQGTPQIGGVPSVQGAPSLPRTPAGSGAPQAPPQLAHSGAPSLPGTPAGSGGSPAAPQLAHGGGPSVAPPAHAAPGTPGMPAPGPHEQAQRYQPEHPQHPQHEHHLHHPVHEQHAEHAHHIQHGQHAAHAAHPHIASKASPVRGIGKTLANKSHVLKLQTATSKGVAAAFTVAVVATVVIIASMHRGGGALPPGGPPGAPILYVVTNSASPQLEALDSNGASVWTFSLPAGGGVNHKPVVANGVLYVVDSTSTSATSSLSLYALRVSNGSTLWKFPLGQSVQVAQPIVSNGVVYISETNYTYALKASDGTILWKYKTNAAASVDPVLGNGVLYVTGDYDNSVCALNISNGTPIWKFTSTISQLLLDHGILYIVSPEAVASGGGNGNGPGPGGGCNGTNSLNASISQILALNASNGASVWNFSLGSFATGNSVDSAFTKAVVQNGVVFVEAPGLNTPGKLYALRADNGSQLWKFITSNQPSPIVVADGSVYFSNSDKNTVYGLRASDGSVLWQKTGFQYPGTPTVANGVVYIANGGNLYAFRASDGSQVWKATGIVTGSPPLVKNGVIYIAEGINIVALRVSDGSQIWTSPVRGMLLQM